MPNVVRASRDVWHQETILQICRTGVHMKSQSLWQHTRTWAVQGRWGPVNFYSYLRSYLQFITTHKGKFRFFFQSSLTEYTNSMCGQISCPAFWIIFCIILHCLVIFYLNGLLLSYCGLWFMSLEYACMHACVCVCLVPFLYFYSGLYCQFVFYRRPCFLKIERKKAWSRKGGEKGRFL